MDLAQIDFTQILSQNLRITRKESTRAYHEMRKKGFGSWLKNQPPHCPAILFKIAGCEQLDLWANPHLILGDYVDSVHRELLHDLKVFLAVNECTAQIVNFNGKGYYSLEIYCYRKGARIMVIENLGRSYWEADDIRRSIIMQDSFAHMLYELMYRYKLTCIAGPRNGMAFYPKDDPAFIREDGLEIVPSKNYHDTRQERYLRQMARHHKLSVTEWLKFHLMVKLYQSSGMTCNFKTLITEIKN